MRLLCHWFVLRTQVSKVGFRGCFEQVLRVGCSVWRKAKYGVFPQLHRDHRRGHCRSVGGQGM